MIEKDFGIEKLTAAHDRTAFFCGALLMRALEHSLAFSQHVASFAVLVDAIDETAARFNRHYGFTEVNNSSTRLFLPMKTIEKMAAEKL